MKITFYHLVSQEAKRTHIERLFTLFMGISNIFATVSNISVYVDGMGDVGSLTIYH